MTDDDFKQRAKEAADEVYVLDEFGSLSSCQMDRDDFEQHLVRAIQWGRADAEAEIRALESRFKMYRETAVKNLEELRGQLAETDVQALLAEHDENVRLHTRVEELEVQLADARETLQSIKRFALESRMPFVKISEMAWRWADACLKRTPAESLRVREAELAVIQEAIEYREAHLDSDDIWFCDTLPALEAALKSDK